jgi:hypothetical protein
MPSMSLKDITHKMTAMDRTILGSAVSKRDKGDIM